MPAVVEIRNKKLQVSTPQSVAQILKEVNLEPESYLVLRNGIILKLDDLVIDQDIIHLIPVVAGG